MKYLISENGLVCLKPDGEIVSYTENNGLLTNYARTIYECSDGRLIVSVTKGLHIIENGKITRTIVTRNYGIPNDVVLSICEGFDGKITTLKNMPTGKRTSGCYDLLLPKGDDIWVCGGTGIYILNAKQLLAGENPDYTFYNGSMGLPHITTSNSRNYVAPNGDVFLSGINLINNKVIDRQQKGQPTALFVVILPL